MRGTGTRPGWPRSPGTPTHSAACCELGDLVVLQVTQDVLVCRVGEDYGVADACRHGFGFSLREVKARRLGAAGTTTTNVGPTGRAALLRAAASPRSVVV